MPDDRSLLDREIQRLELRPFTLEGFHRRRQRRQRNQRVAAGVLGIAVFALAAMGFVRLLGSEGTPAGDSRNPFEGTWVSTSDTDGGTQTMTVRVSAEGAVEIVVRDDVATVCSGTPSTMTGTGRIEAGTQLVIPAPVYTCDDGSEPETLSGPPLQEQLRDWTLFLDPQTDTLSDGVGGVWLREGAEDPSPDPTTSGVMWPQTSLEEVRQAQELADAGDPGYTWQVDPTLGLELWRGPYHAEIYARFVEEKLGWEEFLGMGGAYPGDDVWYVRCAPGGTNPVYPNDPEGGGCAPTIDGFRYETVQIDVAQLDRQGPSGIWVVTRWEMIEPFTQADPRVVEAEAKALLGAFLQARIEGEGAEEYVDALDVDYDEIPFLYATPTGAPYVRSEFEVADGPLWPDGRMRFKVRLFAEDDETVVEQFFFTERVELGLGYDDETDDPGTGGSGPGTTVNGQAVPVPYTFPDGELTLHMTYPWTGFEEGSRFYLFSDEFDGVLLLLGGELPVVTGCLDPAPADVQALARSIRSNPDLGATAPVAVSVGELPALRMDVTTAPGASTCPLDEPQMVVTDIPVFPQIRMRLYLVDLPEGSSAPILAIAISALEPDFERGVESAAPIVDSIEFHTR